MRVADIMTTAIETVAAGTPPPEAREQMRRRAIRHLLVFDGDELIGVVSRKDLEQTGAASVRELIHTRPITVGPRATIREAANLMRGNRIGCLPVVGRGARVEGIITASDLLDLIGKGVDRAAGDPGGRR